MILGFGIFQTLLNTFDYFNIRDNSARIAQKTL